MSSEPQVLDFTSAAGRVRLERHAPGSHVASLRVEIHPEHRRKGYARYLIRQAISEAPGYGVRRIEATPYVGNEVSFALFEALPEFQFEGRKRSAGRVGHRLVDTWLFAWVAPS